MALTDYGEASACTKAGWDTQARAEAELARIRSRRVPQTWKLPIRTYLCPRCYLWHLSSQPDKRKR